MKRSADSLHAYQISREFLLRTVSEHCRLISNSKYCTRAQYLPFRISQEAYCYIWLQLFGSSWVHISTVLFTKRAEERRTQFILGPFTTLWASAKITAFESCSKRSLFCHLPRFTALYIYFYLYPPPTRLFYPTPALLPSVFLGTIFVCAYSWTALVILWQARSRRDAKKAQQYFRAPERN